MKKFLSLFCALSIILSASAVQLTPAKVAPAKKAELVSLKADKAVAAKVAAKNAVAKRNGKVLNKTAKAPMMPQAPATAARKAPKAAMETIDLTFDNSIAPVFEYYAADGDWYLGWRDVTNNYVIRFDYLVGEEGQFGHYTIADLDLDYSYLTDYTTNEKGDVLSYTDADFTLTDKGNDTWSLSGYVVCEDGNTYNLSGYYEKPQGETYDVELTQLVSAYYYDDDMDWYFKVANSEYTFQLDLVSESGMFAGEYTTEDALLNYCSVTAPDSEGEKVVALEISIVSNAAAEALEVPAAFELTGAIQTNKGNTYNIHLLVTAPLEPKQVINCNVECVDLEWPNCDYPGVAGMFIFADTDVPSRAFQVAVDAATGEFTVGEGIVAEYTGMVDYSTLMPYMIDNGTVTVSLDVEKMILIVEAAMVCADTIQYNFTSEIPVELAGVKELSFDNLNIDDSWVGFFGIYFYNAENEEAAISGNFTADNLEDYEFGDGEIACTVNTEAGKVYSLVVTYAHVYNNGKNLDITFIGEDMVLYTVNAKFTNPEPVDDIMITLGGLELTDLREKMGAWQLSGYAPDSTVWASVAVYSSELEGSYTMDDMGALLSYNQIAFMDEDGTLLEEDPLYELYNDIVVTLVPYVDDSVKMQIEVYGQYGVHRTKLYLTSEPFIQSQVPGDKYDMQEDIEKHYATEDIVTFEVDGEEAYAYVRVVKDNEMFAVLFYVEEGATELEAGIYEINDTFEPGTVQPGAIEGSSVYPTYWATTDEEGYLNVPLFFCVKGTVEVSYDAAGKLQLDVNATNTWAHSAHITLNLDEPTAISNSAVKSVSRKELRNGQLIIIRDGKTFNALGAEL